MEPIELKIISNDRLKFRCNLLKYLFLVISKKIPYLFKSQGLRYVDNLNIQWRGGKTC